VGRAVIVVALAIGWVSGCRRQAVSDAAGSGRSLGGHSALEYRGPAAYADRATETLFYVESDGRHVGAIRFDGTVLWTHDLYSDVKRVAWTSEPSGDVAELDRIIHGEIKDRKIVSITRAAPRDRDKVYLLITFTSGDFGVVDATSGEFVSMGRD
jgi:hypothetical protein